MESNISDDKIEYNLRKFHLDDLPKKELYIVLNTSFREKFFKKLYKFIGGSTILSRRLPVQDEAIRRWKVGKRSIPNWALLSLNNLLGNKKFSIEEIEKNIIAYKGESSNKPVTNLKLPLVEDKRLIRIVTHLLCDGYDGGKTHLPTYNNTEKTLIDIFIKDLSVFGDVPYRIRKCDNGWKSKRLLYRAEFSRIITHMLRHLYKIEFKGDVGRLPKEFFSLDPSLSNYCIRAFADDESHVRDSKIFFGLGNSLLLKDFHKLIKNTLNLNLDYITKVRVDYHDSNYYFFELKRKALDKFHKNINFNHPHKRMLLDSIIKRGTKPGNKYPEGVAKDKILNILSKRPSSRVELALKLGIRPKNIGFHLEKLKKANRIMLSHTSNYGAKVWKIKNDENT